MSGDVSEISSEISESEIQFNNVFIEKNLVLQLKNSKTPVLYEEYYAAAADETISSLAAERENKKKILISKTLPIEDEYEIVPLYNIVFDNENYEYAYIEKTAIPIQNDQPIASFYVITSQIDLDDLDDLFGIEKYKVSGGALKPPYKYVFPSLTINDINDINSNSMLKIEEEIEEEIEGKESTKTPVSGGKRRALSSCNSTSKISTSKINAMLQLLYDIEKFKNYIDNYTPDEGEDETVINKNNLAANFKTIFDFINGVGSDEDKNVCPAIESIQTVFGIKNTDDFKTVSITFYDKMNEYFGSNLKDIYGLKTIKTNNITNNITKEITKEITTTTTFPYLLSDSATYKSVKEYIDTLFKEKSSITKLISYDQKYIAIGFFPNNNNKNKMEISNEISVLYNATSATPETPETPATPKTFYLVGYQYLKDDGKSFAYKNIVLNTKFEDGIDKSRKLLSGPDKDTKLVFVALYSSTKPEVLPHLPPTKSLSLSNIVSRFSSPFKITRGGGSDSESDELHKQVQTKFRVSRRKSRKSKK
jgi:hypothetical protein